VDNVAACALIKQTFKKIDGTLIAKQLMQLCGNISMILAKKKK